MIPTPAELRGTSGYWTGWWTVTRNDVPVRHCPPKDRDLAERFATDPAYRQQPTNKKRRRMSADEKGVAWGSEDKEHAMSQQSNCAIAVIGIDIGKNSFHVVGHDRRGAIVLRQKWSRGQVEARLANLPRCPIGMEACVGAHHLSRKLQLFGHNARLMPAKYVRRIARDRRTRRRSLIPAQRLQTENAPLRRW